MILLTRPLFIRKFLFHMQHITNYKELYLLLTRESFLECQCVQWMWKMEEYYSNLGQ